VSDLSLADIAHEMISGRPVDDEDAEALARDWEAIHKDGERLTAERDAAIRQAKAWEDAAEVQRGKADALRAKVAELTERAEKAEAKAKRGDDWALFIMRGFIEAMGEDWSDWCEEDVREMHKALRARVAELEGALKIVLVGMDTPEIEIRDPKQAARELVRMCREGCVTRARLERVREAHRELLASYELDGPPGPPTHGRPSIKNAWDRLRAALDGEGEPICIDENAPQVPNWDDGEDTHLRVGNCPKCGLSADEHYDGKTNCPYRPFPEGE
jgi:hypothetical protein